MDWAFAPVRLAVHMMAIANKKTDRFYPHPVSFFVCFAIRI
jgi:hypothetical protein